VAWSDDDHDQEEEDAFQSRLAEISDESSDEDKVISPVDIERMPSTSSETPLVSLGQTARQALPLTTDPPEQPAQHDSDSDSDTPVSEAVSEQDQSDAAAIDKGRSNRAEEALMKQGFKFPPGWKESNTTLRPDNPLKAAQRLISSLSAVSLMGAENRRVLRREKANLQVQEKVQQESPSKPQSLLVLPKHPTQPPKSEVTEKNWGRTPGKPGRAQARASRKPKKTSVLPPDDLTPQENPLPKREGGSKREREAHVKSRRDKRSGNVTSDER